MSDFDWGGLLSSSLAAGAAGFGAAGLEEIKQEREIARQEGLARLQNELQINLQDNAAGHNKDLAETTFDRNRAASTEDYTRDRADALVDREDTQAFQMDVLGKQLSAQNSGNKTPAEVQMMQYLDSKGLLGQYLSGKGGKKDSGQMTEYQKVQGFNDAVANGYEGTIQDWEGDMGLGGETVSRETTKPSDFMAEFKAKQAELAKKAASPKKTAPALQSSH